MFTRALLKTSQAAILLVAGIFIGAALSSFAGPELELMLGQTKFRERECGTWWQCGPYSVTNNSLISSSYLIGLKWTGERFGFRVGYTRLGEYAGRDNLATVRDEDADKRVLNCDPVTGVECLAIYSGQGRAQGVYFGPTVERSWGGFTALAEVGILYFRSTYDVRVCRIEDNYIVPKGQCFDFNHATGDHFTWYAGLGASYRLFRDASAVVLFRQYYNVYQQGADVGLTGGRTRQILAGVQIPF